MTLTPRAWTAAPAQLAHAVLFVERKGDQQRSVLGWRRTLATAAVEMTYHDAGEVVPPAQHDVLHLHVAVCDASLMKVAEARHKLDDSLVHLLGVCRVGCLVVLQSTAIARPALTADSCLHTLGAGQQA